MSSMLTVLRIETDTAFADIVEEGLRLSGLDVIRWQPLVGPQVRLERFCETMADAAQDRVAIEHCLADWSEGESWILTQEAIADQDWQHAWKAFFQTTRVSSRIIIRPSWEPTMAGFNDIEVVMDPGLSFGTGQHITTQTCLQLLDRLTGARPGISLLDLGCGSGILSIAGARLGCQRVTAVDFDPVAVERTQFNAGENGVGELVSCSSADVTQWQCDTPFDLVVANIFADVLIGSTTQIAASVARDGDLVISGILQPDWDRVLAAFEIKGFAVVEQLGDAEWVTAHLHR